jgi:pyruvate kinase
MVIKTDVKLLRKRRTKIAATLSPASVDPYTIRSLITNGVGVFRMNMSYRD